MGHEKKEIVSQMRKIGKDLFRRGLVGSHSGNMSLRKGDLIYITKRGSMLGSLEKEDIIEVPLEGAEKNTLEVASSETPVHLSIYKMVDSGAVLHAHPPYAVLLSLITKENQLFPLDWEGKKIIGTIFFVEAEEDGEKNSREEKISLALKDHKIVVVRGHGSFARGESLEEAYSYTMSLESSSFFLYHLEALKAWRQS